MCMHINLPGFADMPVCQVLLHRITQLTNSLNIDLSVFAALQMCCHSGHDDVKAEALG